MDLSKIRYGGHLLLWSLIAKTIEKQNRNRSQLRRICFADKTMRSTLEDFLKKNLNF